LLSVGIAISFLIVLNRPDSLQKNQTSFNWVSFLSALNLKTNLETHKFCKTITFLLLSIASEDEPKGAQIRKLQRVLDVVCDKGVWDKDVWDRCMRIHKMCMGKRIAKPDASYQYETAPLCKRMGKGMPKPDGAKMDCDKNYKVRRKAEPCSRVATGREHFAFTKPSGCPEPCAAPSSPAKTLVIS